MTKFEEARRHEDDCMLAYEKAARDEVAFARVRLEEAEARYLRATSARIARSVSRRNEMTTYDDMNDPTKKELLYLELMAHYRALEYKIKVKQAYNRMVVALDNALKTPGYDPSASVRAFLEIDMGNNTIKNAQDGFCGHPIAEKLAP